MIVIFWFSSKTAEKSSESSDRIVDVILGVCFLCRLKYNFYK